MARSIIGRAAIFAGLLHLGAVAEGVPASDPPAVPLVEVQIRFADGGTPRAATGIIWPGGGVLVLQRWIEDAAGASIRAADGVEHPAQGVLAYRTEAGVALLAVDWGGEPPATAKIAEKSPQPGDRVWLQFMQHGEAESLRAEVQVAAGLELKIEVESKQPAESTAGGPLIDESGAVVGVPSSFYVGVGVNRGSGALPSVSPRTGLMAVRCETLRAIKAGPVIIWADWSGTTVPNIRKAEELVKGASALYWKGQAQSDAMVQSLQRAVELDPQNAMAWRMLAASLCTSSEYQPAVDAAARAIALAVTDGPAYTTASWALYHLGRVDGAISAAEHAIELKHDLGGNYWRLGCYLWSQERGDEAVAAFKNCLVHDPKNDKVKKSLAELLRHLGRDEEARQYE